MLSSEETIVAARLKQVLSLFDESGMGAWRMRASGPPALIPEPPGEARDDLALVLAGAHAAVDFVDTMGDGATAASGPFPRGVLDGACHGRLGS